MKTPNFKTNQVFIKDNFEVLRGMNSECVDLFLFDPPFKTNKTRKGKDGAPDWRDTFTPESLMEISSDPDFEEKLLEENHPDLSNWIKNSSKLHSKDMGIYLTYMANRIGEKYRVLKSTGSMVVHLDPTPCHYIKPILDYFFGFKNFRNELIWTYQTPSNAKRQFKRKHDNIFWYVKDENKPYTFNYLHPDLRMPYARNSKCDGKGWGDEIIEYSQEEIDLGQLRTDWLLGFTPVQRLVKEKTGYESQKPLSLYRMLINGLSNPGDLVVDTFCGCATTLIAALQTGRKCIGVDRLDDAFDVIQLRLDDLKMSDKIIKSTKVPVRTDQESNATSISDRKLRRKWQKLMEQNGLCNNEFCAKPLTISDATEDHIIPLNPRPGEPQGTDDDNNVQVYCKPCNSSKGNRPLEVFMAEQEKKFREKFKNIITNSK